MKSLFKFSLKSVFVLTALAALAVFLIPLPQEATCDFRQNRSSALSLEGHGIDIEGRNENGTFETIITNTKLVSVEGSRDLRLGRWKIKFKSNLRNRIRLNKYKILRFSAAEN